MKHRNLLLATAAILSLGACSTDSEKVSEGTSPMEISLVSSLNGTSTRGALDTDASITRLQSTQIAAGETVHAWVEDNSGTASSPYINAWKLTAQGDGSFSGTTQYYPSTGDNVDVYCIHANLSAEPSGAFPTAAITHAVMADQSVAANYLKSDLLYGSVQNQGRKASQPILFKHKLAKIEVKLKLSDGLTVAQLTDAGTAIYIQNTLTTATYTPAKAPALAEGGDIAAYGGTVSATGAASDIRMYLQKETDATAEVLVFGEAIIVPQSVSPTADFIKIHLADGGDLYAKLGGTTAKVFEAGKKYVYTITTSLSSMTLTSSITDWDDSAGEQTITAK
ncbi:MAG: fimbrillin family protein [Prevotella sp.]|nr:fimbrillin family protein [Prevotella sp.]